MPAAYRYNLRNAIVCFLVSVQRSGKIKCRQGNQKCNITSSMCGKYVQSVGQFFKAVQKARIEELEAENKALRRYL